MPMSLFPRLQRSGARPLLHLMCTTEGGEDESHLLGTVSAQLEHVLEVLSDRNWCVTATPLCQALLTLIRRLNFGH